MSLVSAILVLVMCVTGVSADVGTAVNGKYDYSRPASSGNAELNSADILEEYLGAPLSEAEKNYLALHGALSVKYDAGISSSLTVTDYNSNSGELTLFVYEYKYSDKNSNELVWTPVSATLSGQTKALVKDNDRYTATFEGVEEDDSLFATVNYCLSVTVEKGDISSILNKAFLDAPALKTELEEKNAEYLRLLDKYNTELLAHEEYLLKLSEYEVENALYLEYLKQKSIYDQALSEYNKYLKDLSAYEQALKDRAEYDEAIKAYNVAYAEYRAYLAELGLYEERLAEYNAYLGKITTVAEQLAVIEAARTPMTGDRQVYTAIMGSLVSSVLDNKDLITSDLVNVSGDVIDGAGLATENLRQLLTQFYALTSEADKYAYYTVNYEAFRDNFTLLAQCLDSLYRNKRIRAELIYQERDVKYIILVAQLALIANALNGEPIKSFKGDYLFDKSYTIEKKTISQILENKTYFTLTSSPVPLSEGYPSAVTEPTEPEAVVEPIKPTPVTVPAYPDEAPNPGEAPTAVDKPIAPDLAPHPGEEPQPFVPLAGVTELVEEYERGGLTEREEPSTDYILELSATVRKKIFNVTSATVVFYDLDGTKLYTVTVDSGSYAGYVGNIPYKADDARAYYHFDGWMTDDGILPDLSCVETDLVLYPHFAEEIKSYTVSFVVDGTTYESLWLYGDTPFLDTPPVKPSDSVYDYSFVGWDSEITPVSSNATYLAVFDKTYILPLGSGSSGGRVTEGESDFFADCTSGFEPSFRLERLLQMCAASAGKGIALTSRFGEINIPYTSALTMQEAGVDTLTVSTVSLGANGYRYSVSCSADGVTLGGFKMTVSLPCRVSVEKGTTLSYLNDKGEKVGTVFDFDGENIAFTLLSGREYTLTTSYTLHALQYNETEISLSLTEAYAGDTVSIDFALPLGYELIKAFYVVGDTETVIEGNSFVMPRGDVTVGLEYRQIRYKVTFMNGDKIISSAYYHYGDTVVLPGNPSRVDSTVFKYTFRCWSPEVTAVSADAVYYAEYDAEYIPYKEPDDSLKISDSVMRLIVAGGIAAGMILLVVVPSAVIGIVFSIKDKKLYKNKKNKPQQTP